jgi:hypothetical protein
MTTSTTPRRHRARWTVSELNNLHNEYELKELTVQEIAEIHGRTVYGVMGKLQAEGLIDSSWNNARGWVFQNQYNDNQSILLQPALQSYQDDDADDMSVEQDDPEDEDYVPDEDEDEDEDDEDDDNEDEDEDFDPYSVKQKVAFLEQQITNIFSFLQKQFPKHKVMDSAM